jgi:hypothetical protein
MRPAAKAIEDRRFKLDRTRGDRLDLKTMARRFTKLNRHRNTDRTAR